MTDVYQTYNEVISNVNKEENGYLKSNLFNDLSRIASRFVFNDYQSRLQNPNTAAVEKQKLQDRLHPFVEYQELLVEDGLFGVPADYAYFISAKALYDGGQSLIELNALNSKLCLAEEDPSIDKEAILDEIKVIMENPSLVSVQFLDNEQVGRRLNSFISGKRPSVKKPIMWRERGGRFHISPESEASLFMSYYRRPKNAVLVMNELPTLDLQYNQAASTQYEWEDEAMSDITSKIVGDFAIYIRENGLFQMNQVTKAEGK
jgi:hypothetical protein